MTSENQDLQKPDENSQPIALPGATSNEDSGGNARQNTPQTQPAKTHHSSTSQAIWRAFVFLMKFVLTFIILGIIAAGLYFGWPYIYNQYILPVKDNISRVTVLETNQNRAGEQLASIETQQAETFIKQAQQDGSISDLNARVGLLEAQIASQTASLAALEKMQVLLQANNDQITSQLDRQIKLLKGMELLSRARLFLYQSNFGLAKQDVQTARGILAGIQTTAPEQEGKDLAEVVNRLDLALSRLPEFPVPASDDVDIAWQLLLQGIPQIPAPTATETATTAVTATPGVTATPSPGDTPAPTSTP